MFRTLEKCESRVVSVGEQCQREDEVHDHMRRQCSRPFLPGFCFGKDFVDNESRNCSRQGAECDVVGQFPGLPVSIPLIILNGRSLMAVLMFRHAVQFPRIYPMGIVESPVVFGCGQNRSIISPINQAPPKAQYRAGPPRAHRPASAGKDVRQQGLTTWH